MIWWRERVQLGDQKKNKIKTKRQNSGARWNRCQSDDFICLFVSFPLGPFCVAVCVFGIFLFISRTARTSSKPLTKQHCCRSLMCVCIYPTGGNSPAASPAAQPSQQQRERDPKKWLDGEGLPMMAATSHRRAVMTLLHAPVAQTHTHTDGSFSFKQIAPFVVGSYSVPQAKNVVVDCVVLTPP